MTEPDSDPDAARAREEAIWRDIVVHYGEEPEVPDLPNLDSDLDSGLDSSLASGPAETPPSRPSEPSRSEPEDTGPRTEYDPVADRDVFVPGDPGPHPIPEPRTALAWAGVVVTPLILLVCVIASWSPPTWADALLLAWFVGGFGYLIAILPKGRDEDDDGARL